MPKESKVNHDAYQGVVLGKYRFKPGKEGMLGEGSFSVVRKGIDEKTGADVAIKSYKLDKIRKDSKEMASILLKYKRQIQVLQDLGGDMREQSSNPRLAHPSFTKIKCEKLFLKLLDFSKDRHGSPGQSEDGTMYVVTEVADYSLKDYLEARHEQHMPITPDVVKQITNNFLLCVAILHAKGYAHLDIKPENIMRGNSIWKLIDVDGCVPLNKEISIDDQTISFSPCYCAPEWANFLVGGGKRLMIRDALDVWSVGLSLCELIILDAALKPKYASLFRAVGSHRKAGFLFLEWLANPNEKLVLDKKIGEYDKEFVDLVLRQMLVKNYERRMTLAECLSHPFIKDVRIPGLDGEKGASTKEPEMDKAAEVAMRKRRERAEEGETDRPPMHKGVMFKMNADGDLKNREHWLKRDMWLSHNGALCYFSQKKNKRLVLLDHASIVRCTIRRLTAAESCQEYAFAIIPDTVNDGCDSAALAEAQAEAQYYGCENEAECIAWMEKLNKAVKMEIVGDKMQLSAGLMEDFANFKIEVKNRREKFDKTKGFEPAYKCELWKLNQEGDIMTADHWLKREMWIAKNGAFCYYSKKEGRELQYYKSTDIRYVMCDVVADEKSCKPHTFTLTLPSQGGLEYAPGVFAALNAEEKDNFLYTIKKFQRARAQHDAALRQRREKERAAQQG